MITLVNVGLSLRGGKRAGNDPWKGSTLALFTQSPSPNTNFDVVPRMRTVEPIEDIRREILEREARPAGSIAEPVASRAS